ncbi:uncharacterized protein BDFB_003782 [Asbolus verrucosus]|uniref:CHK kinase-like domain-containing protein n=1 Tax=Asbolus verrucosus TaxID=1661398 RepID=A0A482VM90_ASBVE|nr:uncharacterized protein BDFB_003782 [Asbolus verrucosus]
MSFEELQKIISPKFTQEVVRNIADKVSGLSETELQITNIEDTFSKNGDAYLSQICRFGVNVKGKNQSGEEEIVFIPIIVKYLPKNVARRKTYRSTVFFENESIFYEKVWTAFKNFYKSKEIQDKFDNIPLVLSIWIDGSDDYVAMLDVSYQGYKNVDRESGLDYDHTVAILKLLAGFHSLSLAFKDQQPDLFEKAASSLKETYFDEKYRTWYARFQERLFVVARDAVGKELPPVYLEKLNKFISIDLFGEMCKSCQGRGPFAVVTHGDVWVPNFLIKYNGTTPERIILIDFQLSRYASLSNDLIFFLYSCVDIDLIEKHWDDFIIEYHQALTKNLEKYGSDRNLATLEALQAELRTGMVFGVGASIEALIMSLLSDEDIGDLNEIEGEDAVPVETVWLVHPFKEQKKRERFAKMIKHAKTISPKFTEQTLFDIVNKKSGLSDVKVNKIETGASSKKGDSYLSNVCRFIIEATGKNSVILSSWIDGSNDYIAMLDVSYEGYGSADRGDESLVMSLLEDDEVSDLDAIQGVDAVPLETVWIVHPFKEQNKRKRIANMIKFAVDKNFI